MKSGIILDTDIGYDPDDMFALLLALKSPEIGIDLIVTGDEVSGKRANFAKKILEQLGYSDTKVVQGVDLGNNKFIVGELIGDSYYPIDQDYLTAMKAVIDSSQRVIYIGIQGLTNLANFLKKFPESKDKLRIYQMGGAIDYSVREGWVEHNISLDKESAQYVLGSGCDISLVMAQTTFNPRYMVDNNHPIFRKLKSSTDLVYQMLARHCELFHEAHGSWPYMHDPLTVAEAMGKSFVTYEESAISMDEYGNLSLSTEGPKVRLSKKESRDREFMKFLGERLFE